MNFPNYGMSFKELRTSGPAFDPYGEHEVLSEAHRLLNFHSDQVSMENVYAMLASVDYVPPTLPMVTGLGKCVIFEDNDAVIKLSLIHI